MKKIKYLLLSLALCFSTSIFSQPTKAAFLPQGKHLITVSGKVVGTNGEAIVGATIVIKGTTRGTVTNTNGNYSLSNVPSNATLEFSFVGMETKDVKVANRSTINITMVESATGLNKVVVIGYGTRKKSDLTGSMTTVNVKAMKEYTTNDVTKALEGRVPGLSIQSGGEPGAVPIVKLRGVSSFNNSTPLYVIDGVPTPVNNYPVSDIASIEVLKGASACAIYGSRAANGVILITTKKGQAGKMKVTYDAYVGMQNIVNTYSVCNRVQYQKLVNLATTNALATDPAYTGHILPFNDPSSPYFSTTNTNWQKAFLKTGEIENHTLSISGGNSSSTYYLSLNYFNNTGTLVGRGPNYKRYSFNSSLTQSYGKRLKLGENFSYTFVNQNLMTFVKDGTAIGFMVEAIPTIPIYDSTTIDGYGASNKQMDGSYTANVIGMNKMIQSNTKQYKFWGSAWGQYAFFPFLKYKLLVTFDRSDFRDFHFDPIHNLGWAYYNAIATMNEDRSEAWTGQIENTLTFNKKFGDNSINFLLGTSFLEAKQDWTNAYAQGFSQPYFEQISNGATTSATGGASENTLNSYYARLFYTFKDKYLLTATIRRDGSSRFAPSYRWGNFPSVALAWKINKESFMKKYTFINLLKLRASWGELGNQSIGDYLYSAQINPYASYIFGGNLNQGSAQITYVAPDIHWEAKTTKDIGIDGALFNDRLTFSADYYYSLSSDMLVQVTLPYSTGVYSWEAPTINGASVSNQGFEFQAAYKQHFKNFNFSIGGNISTLKNKILSLGYGNHPIYGTISKSAVGHSVGEFYGYVIDGIFQNQGQIDALNAAAAAKYGAGTVYQSLYTSPGDYKFKDLNGDGIINSEDQTYLGSAIPDLYFGLNITASYKIFDLAITGNGVAGNKIFDAIRAALEYGGGADQYSTRELNSWTPTNTNTNIPRVVMGDPNGNSRNSSRWLEDGSYFKITSVELGVTIPDYLLKRAGITHLRVYLQGENLYTLTKYTGFDPDFGSDGLWDRGVDHGSYPNKAFTAFSGGLPNPRTLLVGLQLGF